MLSEVQKRLLDMLQWFHQYCVNNNFRYYIIAGTMLGAIRHKVFMPWDDDIDVVLPRPDYDRLIQTFNNREEQYFLESPYTGNSDYCYSFAKLYDTRTTLTERTRRNCRRGLYVDVFPLDGVGTDIEEARRNFRKVDRMNMFLMTRTCPITKERKLYKNIVIFASQLIPSFIVNDQRLIKKLDHTAASVDYDSSHYVGSLMAGYREKEIMEKRIYGKPTEYLFENIVVYGVEHYEEYLTHIYGDWRKLLPVEKRKTTHQYIELDLEKPYLQ